jgi:hypothetical protein
MLVLAVGIAVMKAFVIFNFKHRVFKIKKRGRGPGFFEFRNLNSAPQFK